MGARLNDREMRALAHKAVDGPSYGPCPSPRSDCFLDSSLSMLSFFLPSLHLGCGTWNGRMRRNPAPCRGHAERGAVFQRVIFFSTRGPVRARKLLSSLPALNRYASVSAGSEGSMYKFPRPRTSSSAATILVLSLRSFSGSRPFSNDFSPITNRNTEGLLRPDRTRLCRR